MIAPALALKTFRDAQLSTIATSEPSSLDDFAKIPLSPLSSFADDVLEIPKEWAPAGYGRNSSARRIKVLSYLPTHLTRHACEYHETLVRRILYFLWFYGPRARGKSYAASTYVAMGDALIKCARWALENRFRPESLFSHLSSADLTSMRGASSACRFPSLMRDLTSLHKRGLLSDAPVFDDGLCAADEPSNRDVEIRPRVLADCSPILPFPDALVTELGWRCLWLTNELGPTLLNCFEKLHDRSRLSVNPRDQGAVTEQRAILLAKHKWIDSRGRPIKTLPFPIVLPELETPSNRPKLTIVRTLPLRYYAAVRKLVAFLQVAHYCILALSIGPRFSEVAGADLDCITLDHGPEFNSKTYKLSTRIGGQERTYPISEVATRVLEQQQRLARIVAGASAKSLFVKLQAHTASDQRGQGRGTERHDLNHALRSFFGAVGVNDLLNGTQPTTHRFRKSVARLIALAIIDAPLILMELFGHKNLEMTIAYILTDPQLRAEYEQVSKEVAYAMTESVLLQVPTSSGPAAPKLRAGLDTLAVQMGHERYGTENIAEAIDILSTVGMPFQAVRPGIICTKQLGQLGACTLGRGAPNPALCRVNCDHRLELASARAQVNEVVRYLIGQIGSEPNELIRANLEGQLLHNLSRFDDIRERWVEGDEIAAKVWKANRGGE